MNASTRHWAATHPGKRTSNQDAFLCRSDLGLFAVADGVSGTEGGAFASAEVVRVLDAIPSGLTAAGLLVAVKMGVDAAHRRLVASASSQAAGAATTAVILLLHDGHAACLWAGDSRAYLLRGGELYRLTSDHSLVGEMLRVGLLTSSQAAGHPQGNVITRAVGVAADGPLLDKAIGLAEPGDRFLLCSDGLTKALDEGDIGAALDGDDPARALVEGALFRQAKDNITALVLSYEGPGAVDKLRGSPGSKARSWRPHVPKIGRVPR